MKRFVQILLAALGLCSGCSKSAVLTPRQFTKEFAKALSQTSSGLKVEIVRDLELKVTSADGRDSTSFLHNPYDMYKQNPGAKGEIIRKFLAAHLETVAGTKDGIDRTRIVPVIKDRPWLEETRQAMLNRGAKKTPEYVYEDFNPDLIILYAEDSPKTIRYLTPKDLDDMKILRKDLRPLACENLKRLLPMMERVGTNGFYIVRAGGDYDASLLLLDSIWNDGQIGVQGDIVVAIPMRNLLLVTGTKHPQAIEKVRQLAKDSFAEGSYRLTPKLFVYRNGKFDELKLGSDLGPTKVAQPLP